jgi:hypothetical protein
MLSAYLAHFSQRAAALLSEEDTSPTASVPIVHSSIQYLR